MRIARLNHVQISIPIGAETEARAFYCGVLGLREIEKPESLQGRGGLWVEIGDQQIHFGVEDGVDRAATRAHLAYEVDDLAAWHDRLTANGAVIKESIQFPGFNRFESRDPFGNRIEFIQPL